MAFGTRPKEYVLKTVVEQALYDRFAALSERNRRSLSKQLLLAVEEQLQRENGKRG
jgi:hypothetical protein